VPFLQTIFNTVPLGWAEWKLIIPLFLVPSLSAEAVKYVMESRKNKRA